MQLLFRVVARAAFLLVNCIKRYHTNVTHHLEQSAGQRDLCSVSVDLPSASENISVLQFRDSLNYSPPSVDPGVTLLLRPV